MTTDEQHLSIRANATIISLLKEIYGVEDMPQQCSEGYWWFVWRIGAGRTRPKEEWIFEVYLKYELLLEVRGYNGFDDFVVEVIDKLTELKIKKDENSC